MLTSTYDNRPRQELHGFIRGKVRTNESGTVYQIGRDSNGKPAAITLPTVDFRAIEPDGT